MTLTPLFEAPVAVRLHVYTVLPAFVAGTWLLFASRKGSAPHRLVGRLYAVLMLATCAAAAFVHVLNPNGFLGLSFVHLFIGLTFFGLYRGIRAARRGDVARHRRAMLFTYVGGLLIVGSFTLMPGRLMHTLIFGG